MNTIQTNSNYVVFKKLLSIHSEDRDIKKWADPNMFEITAPVEYKNVVSLRLNDIELPSSYYVFSEMNQNTKLSFKVIPVASNWVIDGSSIATKLSISPIFTLSISSGTYTGDQLALELTMLLNNIVTTYIGNFTYTFFNVKYNPVTMKLMFFNTRDNFQFHFTSAEMYDTCSSKLANTPLQGVYYENYTNWGLGSYLGFDKNVYTSTLKTRVTMSWNTTTPLLTNVYYIEPEYTLNVHGDSHIYMELMYYNSMDEITPYAEKSNWSSNAKFGGKHNASFAKIPLFPCDQELNSSPETYLSNIFFSDPPLERVQKFKILMRHHDGRIVDFNNCNYNFTIEITMLKPDTIKPLIKVNSSNYVL
jgi:hypothetical protein